MSNNILSIQDRFEFAKTATGGLILFNAGSNLSLRLAQTQEDHQAAQRLRYRVFIQELGGDGALVDHTNQFEIDRFDTFFDHLVLIDERRSRAD